MTKSIEALRADVKKAEEKLGGLYDFSSLDAFLGDTDESKSAEFQQAEKELAVARDKLFHAARGIPFNESGLVKS